MAKTLKRAIAVLMSVLMIATALPFTAITAMAADKIIYEFDVYGNDTGAYTPGVTENKHTYDLWGNNGSITSGSGLLVAKGGCLFVNDQTVRDYVHSGAFSVEFTGKIDNNENYTMLGMAYNADGGEVFRFDSNGELIVNNSAVATIAISKNIMNDYALSYANNTVKFYVNGIEKASVEASVDCSKISYVSLGWTDRTPFQTKSTATFDSLAISNGAFDPAQYLANNKTRATADNNAKKTGNAVGRFYNDTTTGYYNNLLFCNNDVVWSDENGKSGCLYKVAVPNKIVALYDGSPVSFPIKLEPNYSGAGGSRYLLFVESDTANYAIKNNWLLQGLGYSGNNNDFWNVWKPSDMIYNEVGYTESTVGTSLLGYEASTKRDLKGWHCFLLNQCYYTGTVNTDSYYEHTTSLGMKTHLDSSTSFNVNNTVYTPRANLDIYVINYKPIADIYNSVKAEVAEVASKPAGYYVNEAEFYSKAADILTLDPNAGCYDYFGHLSDATHNVAASVKNAVEAYNNFELVKHTCVEGEATLDEDSVVIPSAEQVGSHDMVTYCTLCGEEVTRTTVTDLYYDAYNAAVVSANAELDNADIYVSVADLESALAEAKTKAENATTQKDIDDAVTMIESAINSLVKKGYTVNVSIQKNGVEIATDTASVNAGDVYTYTATGESIYKVVYNDKKILSDNNEFSVVVTKDMDITVYLADAVADDTKVKATFKAANGVIVAIQYYESKADINVSKVAAPAIPFYNFDQWARVTDSDKNVVFEATYSPAIVEVVDQCNIIVADGEDIIIKNELTEYTAYYDEIVGFNAGGQKIGMYADAGCTELLAYVDSDFYMHAPHRSVVYLKAADETGKHIGITGQYSYIDEAGMQTVVFNGNTFNASSASEVGVIATVSSGLAYSDNFSLEGKANGVKGIVKAESTKQTSIGEFTVAIHSNFGAYTKVYAKPYMIINGTTYYGNVEYVNVAPLN